MNDDITEIVDFMTENSSKYIMWEPERLIQYVKYYRDHAACGMVRAKGKIVAIGIARTLELFNLRDQEKNHYHIARPGNVLFVNEICATDKKAIPVLWDIMIQILGVRPYFAGKRHGKLKLWNFNKYQNRMKLLQRQ